MKDFFVYTAARFLIFGLCYAVVIGIYLALGGGTPLPFLWPVMVAAIASVVISAYVLRDMRARVADQVDARARRMSQRIEEMKAKEDTD